MGKSRHNHAKRFDDDLDDIVEDNQVDKDFHRKRKNAKVSWDELCDAAEEPQPRRDMPPRRQLGRW